MTAVTEATFAANSAADAAAAASASAAIAVTKSASSAANSAAAVTAAATKAIALVMESTTQKSGSITVAQLLERERHNQHRESQAIDKMFRHAETTQTNFLTLASLYQTPGGVQRPQDMKSSCPKWTEVAVKCWDNDHVYDFMANHLQMPVIASAMMEQKIDGLDFWSCYQAPHYAKFDVAQLLAELSQAQETPEATLATTRYQYFLLYQLKLGLHTS
jgi:hypothetical protein